jgi:hypothetical protein
LPQRRKLSGRDVGTAVGQQGESVRDSIWGLPETPHVCVYSKDPT